MILVSQKTKGIPSIGRPNEIGALIDLKCGVRAFDRGVKAGPVTVLRKSEEFFSGELSLVDYS